MKKLFALALVGATALSLSAQTFRPNAVSGALLGGLAGAIIGNNSGSGNGGKGALIGAAAGAVIGAVADDAHDSWRHDRTQVRAPRVAADFRVHDHRYGPAGYYGHRRVSYRPYYPRYGYTVWPESYLYRYPSYGSDYGYNRDYGYASDGDSALGGAIVGAGLGAIIGNNTGSGNGARGALWGALAGAVIGSANERSVDRPYRRVREYRAYDAPAETTAAPAAQTQQAQAQQVTIINNYYNTSPMSSANSLFGR